MYRRCGFRYEKKLRALGVIRIAGIDEAGRGALAGPGVAASVIAKVTRDRLMREFCARFPEYCFGQHKGYGTELHLIKLHEHGPCPIHRRSFEPVAQPLLALELVSCRANTPVRLGPRHL